MTKLAEYAKAVVGAVVAAGVAALAGVDWQAVVLAAIAGAGGVGAVPNREKRRR